MACMASRSASAEERRLLQPSDLIFEQSRRTICKSLPVAVTGDKPYLTSFGRGACDRCAQNCGGFYDEALAGWQANRNLCALSKSFIYRPSCTRATRKSVIVKNHKSSGRKPWIDETDAITHALVNVDIDVRPTHFLHC